MRGHTCNFGCAAEKRTDFTARNLANFLWGLAKTEHHPGEQMLTDLAREIARTIDGANAQNLVSLRASTLPSEPDLALSTTASSPASFPHCLLSTHMERERERSITSLPAT